MIGYNELYEILRKEKYSEALQSLPKNFLNQFKEYISERSKESSASTDLFSDSIAKSKKQLENSFALFRELILKRKKKILNLVFIATETGIMKRDYENMLEIEKQTFDTLVKAFEEGDKSLSNILNNKQDTTSPYKMIIFKSDVEQFMDHTGNTIGPFTSGQLANLDTEVAQILVSGEKATFVDEN